MDVVRRQAIRSFDQSGVNELTEVDFKGNPLVTEQSLAANYKTTIDWTALLSETTLEDIDDEAETNFLENDVYQSRINYDGLNRPTLMTQPDGSQHQPSYAKSGLLEKMEVQLAHESVFTEYVSNIIYNARGQRTDVFYANGSKSAYTYDAATFRLKRILSTRNTGADILQDLNYTFDAAGNIVHLKDDAQQTIYFSNSVVVPENNNISEKFNLPKAVAAI